MFVAAIVMVRMADKRFLSKKSAFDAVLGLILASTLARAVNGSAPFVPTLVGGFVLVLLHRLAAAIAFHWHSFGHLIKGSADVLIENGKLNEQQMRRNAVTIHDLEEDLRLNGSVSKADEVQLAKIERNGELSVIKKKSS